jgi:phosphatidylserine/phosphatidylglycerophosphate/cardiolipin synthase-like enzyme/uncharacterized membrane protein YdjX (TVP38/TMEM64 family)
MSLLVAGENCWRVGRARRLAFLVDGESYFAVLRSALAAARRTIFILGWDFDSRVRLVPSAADGYPEELGAFLRALAHERRQLHVYVLSWDFAMAFALDREWMPLYKLGWREEPAPRLHFRLDGRHPTGSSHHQKVVVVDDAVAFCGGLDLTHGRWDTSAHHREEQMRRDVRGRPSRANHDVQAIVDGVPARALAELARDRWRRGAGRPCLALDPAPGNDPWPPMLAPDVTDLDVAVSRTDPGYAGAPAAHEIRNLYVDAIRCAERFLYLENQYFSSTEIGAALEARLREADGPEVVVVSRLTEEGWLEQRTMGVLRARLHQRLRAADGHGRYRLLYPYLPQLEGTEPLNVHSKVLIADDELCTVGSANFNNRSMGYDTECNLAFEAGGDARLRRAIAAFRGRLLGEHLAVEPGRISLGEDDSLVERIQNLAACPGRTLLPLEPQAIGDIDKVIPASAILDPERFAEPDALVEEFVPPDLRRPMAVRVARFAVELVAVALVVAVWRWTPLHELVPAEAFAAAAASSFAPWAAIGAYILGTLLTIPIGVLILATALLFHGMAGMLLSLAGAFAAALALYGIGRLLGRYVMRRLAGRHLNRITRRLAQHGALAIAVLRIVPVASYAAVSAVAGASYIRLRTFALGTLLGTAPLVVIAFSLVDRARAAYLDPGPVTYASLAAVVGIVAAGGFIVWRRFGAA